MMVRPSPERAREQRQREVLALLALLARRGAYAARAKSDPEGAALVVRQHTSEMEKVIGHASRQAVTEAERHGWVAEGPGTDGGDPILSLTKPGREALKRLRSLQTLARTRPDDGHGTQRRSATPGPATNAAESPLAWLYTRKGQDGQPMISEAQFDAGERLRADLTFAGLTPRTTMSWTGIPGGRQKGPGGGGPHGLSDNVLAARQRVMRALSEVGEEHAGILIDVCGHLKGLEAIASTEGWPRRSAKLLLQRALTALARHYGLLAPVCVERTLAQRLRHWGTRDYRPTLRRWTDDGDRGAEGSD